MICLKVRSYILNCVKVHMGDTGPSLQAAQNTNNILANSIYNVFHKDTIINYSLYGYNSPKRFS